ncbi:MULTISPECIES: hypothetical protein [unclassified Pseudomonas]|uniref:hypothetical protein n=1 Tax=unclassified Pseudomonas TaxID=196821 RepID=UPI00128BFD25|nr:MULTISPECIES: hypothetical protein [unclassified Pseudomonas]MPQ67794.1 hypothetical protein [Pseudomonas sp. MWU12-2323]
MAIGKCLLTGATGTFAKSHLYPLAFTAPAVPGSYFIQAGEGTRPIRTFTSWYDKKILTHKGEKIISLLDDKGIKELRRLHLVWSGWGGEDNIPPEIVVNRFDEKRGIRKIQNLDSSVLRLFFLSVLWRWGQSSLSAAKHVKISEANLEVIRRMILENDPGEANFFGMTLTQISTRGAPHNLAPIKREMEKCENEVYSYIRFYFDGLVVHIHTSAVDIERFGVMLLGQADELVVIAIDHDRSFQFENMGKMISETNHLYPQVMKKLN